ncbi:hypothetical protein DVH26_36280 [Paenibacillus sp. H1-7]|uniref:LicD family protein n=1 Tax=Paenibacillus sp. H1-7 TaxID=2282849 RepID=UPI001EF814F6|nr:LicD family protein [Paenibacillus sp. H1-7]ULL19394.1 hypothetical protein DVH26_36280 [Paenibacillus sp. H1-7]
MSDQVLSNNLLRKLQLKGLDILKQIDKLCKDNNIKYSLIGGSAIGAIVHKGCIPWDDDIDIIMDRENFEKFKAVCKKELPSNLTYHDYHTDHSLNVLIAKIVDNTTTCISTNQYGHERIDGVYIDISVFDTVPKSRFQRLLQYFFSNLALLYVNRAAPENQGLLIKKICRMILLFTPKKYYYPVISFCEAQIVKYCKHKEGFLAEMLFFRLNKLYFPINLMKEFVAVEFEGCKFPIIKNYHDYLLRRYARDYTILPPEEERKPHHNIKYLNLNKGYGDYKEESLLSKLSKNN